MANEIRQKDLASGIITITLAGMANAVAGGSLEIANTDYPAAKIGVKIKTGATGVLTTGLIIVYLLDKVGNIRVDNAGVGDVTFVPICANMIGTIPANANATTYYAIFNTYGVTDCLGVDLKIGIENKTGVALDATAANHAVEYYFYVPEIQ